MSTTAVNFSASFRDLNLDEYDTTSALEHAAEQAVVRRYEDFMIVDVDSHHYETEAFQEITNYIEDPVFRHEAKYQGFGRGGLNAGNGGYQAISGRIVRYPLRRKEKTPPQPHRDVTLTRRWMDAMGVDVTCLFPTGMLSLGLVPRQEVESELAWAYNRWVCEKILCEDKRIRSMLYLPLHDGKQALRIVEAYGDKPGVVGFMVTSSHPGRVHSNALVRAYGAVQELGMPIAFHSGLGLNPSLTGMNRFMGVHALGFAWHNMVQMTNWLLNGMPERFPRLKTIWIESGLAWIPFLMQRLDNEWMMRPSDAPLLKRKPSDYMREMYYSTQPMEMVANQEALQLTFKMMNAETQLLYSSDYPHWDMDLPSTIYDLPFLSEEAKRNILGGNAQRLFKLETTLSDTKLKRRAARAGGGGTMDTVAAAP